MTLFEPREFQERIHRLQHLLGEKNIDAAVFNQSADLLYYAGSAVPLYFVVPADGGAFLLARKGSARITEESAHLALELFSNSKDLSSIFKKHNLSEIKLAGFTADLTSYGSVDRMIRLMGNPEAVDVSNDVRSLRMVKSPAEIAILRNAAKIISEIPEIIRKNYRKGITELELSAHIEFHFRMNGGGIIASRQEGLLMTSGVLTSGINALSPNKFDGICAGPGVSPALPFGGSDAVIPEHTPIICDYGFVLRGYHVDLTRMFSAGNPPEKALKAHDAMLAVQQDILSAMKPGATCESVWLIAEKSAADRGYADEFMGLGSEKVRFAGHGLGLYLDEPPYLAPKMQTTLEENMVIAIEPKVSLRGIGVVGIENTVLVKAGNPEILTTCADDFYILQ